MMIGNSETAPRACSRGRARAVAPIAMIRRLNIIGLALVVGVCRCFGGWAATSELAGAVIASGTVIVETVDKKVQHPTGGVVKEILVEDGSVVEEGQVLVRLDDTVPRATLGVLRSQFDETQRTARAPAGRARRRRRDRLSRRSFARATDEANVAVAIGGEEKLFEVAQGCPRRPARPVARTHLAEQGGNPRARRPAAGQGERDQAPVRANWSVCHQLYKKNLVSISRYMQLQREQTRLQGERGQFIADIARARAKISETELQIIQLDQDFRTEVLKDLRETEGKIAELIDRMVAAEDQLKRIDIRAPRSGVVHSLAVHTIGGVIGNGETIMSIVPRGDDLVVEAKVMPSQIDQISIGAATMVRINAGNQRTTPELNGTLTRVAADLTRDQANVGASAQSYYLVRVSLAKNELARLGEFRLLPGMPAEVFIQTSTRTPLQYLLKPLREQIARTFRER